MDVYILLNLVEKNLHKFKEKIVIGFLLYLICLLLYINGQIKWPI